MRDASAQQASRTRCTDRAGERYFLRWERNDSPRPGVAPSRKPAIDLGWVHPQRVEGSAGSMRISPETELGSAIAWRVATSPPMELPTRITGRPATSRRNPPSKRR
jgi:hypothetical protein